MPTRLTPSIFAIVLIIAGTAIGQQASLSDSSDMAADLAKKANDAIAAKVGTNAQYRVAVFPFGDADNKVTMEMGSESISIQGELIFQLRKVAAGKYFVLDKAGLSREFKSAAVDPSSINP